MGIFRRSRKDQPNDGVSPPPLPPILPGPFQSIASQFAKAPLDYLSAPRTASAGDDRTSKRLFVRLYKRLPVKYRLAVAVPALSLGALAMSFAVMMVYYTVTFPHPLSMRAKERAPIVRILARDGAVLAERGGAHDYMPIDLLPRHVVAAVVATEDRRFFDHYGLDPIGLGRAAFANLRAGRVAQGGSTLTQQLAKNLFLSPDRTFARKAEELALAMWLELRLSKLDILELYLNRVYFGGGAYGIEAASQRYFDKSARELSIAEAAVIAGLLKAPSKYAPTASQTAALNRARVVLANMVDAGMISKEDERRAGLERLVFADRKAAKDASGIEYAMDFVLEHLPPLVGSGHAEVIVETTLDAALQRRSNEIVTKGLARQGETLGVSQAGVVVLDTDGGVRAMIGGRDYSASQFNRAVKARRQPGSAFKPFVYLAALESGMMPSTVTYDLPVTIDGWAPRNDNGQFVGEVTLREALAKSINTVAVRLNQMAGRGRTIAVARRLGISSELREGPSLALGTSEVGLLELTGAYAAFGNGGLSVQPHIIRRVRISSGRVLYAREAPRGDQVVDPLNVGAMNDMLHAALTSGTGRRAAIPHHPAAGKTGTTQDFRDAWFVGYTGHLTAGVWIGNDAGKPMNRATGGSLPAELWHQIMRVAHEGKAPLPLPGTSETLPWGATPVAAAAPGAQAQPQYSTRQPGSVAEMLPWAAENRQIAKSAPPPSSNKRIRVTPPAPKYPSERIDDDFIAKALAAAPPQNAGEALANAKPTPQPVARPQGMMSLGGWW
jgi:penicillin-binding protein 1A